MENLTVKEAVVIATILLCFILIMYLFARVDALAELVRQMQMELSKVSR